MTAANSGAVFFLGNRAHYQVLSPPATSEDVENGNTSTETLEAWPEDLNDNHVDHDNSVTQVQHKFDFGGGVKRRLRKRTAEGSSELILNDNDTCDQGDTNTDNASDKSEKAGGWSLRALVRGLLRPRPDSECRCMHCQSTYFDCDDEDGDYDYDFESYYDVNSNPESPPLPPPYKDNGRSERSDKDTDEDDDDEVFLPRPPPAAAPLPPPLPPARTPLSSEEEEMPLELAAGGPVLFDHLLNHPVTCCVQ